MNTETQTFPLTGLHCGACVRRVTQALEPLASEVAVSLEPMQVVLKGAKAPLAALQAAVAQAGAYTLGVCVVLDEKTAKIAVDSARAAIISVAISSTDARSWWATYRPLLLLLAMILGASVLAQLGQSAAVTAHETMRLFMAGFFLCFAFFKLLDLPAFASAYAGYDLLAARWQGWGYVYPFVELALGAAYLINFAPVLTNWVTLVVMGFSALGVLQAVLTKQKIRCACLGAVFQLPMSTVTVVEDLGMVAMAVWMLWVVH